MAASKPSIEEDIAEVTRIHDEWWAANTTLDVARMRPCFAVGAKFLQYNLNGHVYRSLDELTQLWEAISQIYGLPQFDVIDMRVEVRGDMAWVAHEAILQRVPHAGKSLPPSAIPNVPFRVRETEVLHRDDGAGNPVWKIWHHHCSMHAADDAPRPGFGDTVLSRRGG